MERVFLAEEIQLKSRSLGFLTKPSEAKELEPVEDTTRPLIAEGRFERSEVMSARSGEDLSPAPSSALSVSFNLLEVAKQVFIYLQ